MTATWTGRIAGKNQRVGKARDGHIYARKPYADFLASLAWALRAQRAGTFPGDVAVSIEYDIDPARDLDSAIAATFDALEDAGVVTNDNQVAELHVVRRAHPRGQADRVLVCVDNRAPMRDTET